MIMQHSPLTPGSAENLFTLRQGPAAGWGVGRFRYTPAWSRRE